MALCLGICHAFPLDLKMSSAERRVQVVYSHSHDGHHSAAHSEHASPEKAEASCQKSCDRDDQHHHKHGVEVVCGQHLMALSPIFALARWNNSDPFPAPLDIRTPRSQVLDQLFRPPISA